MVAEGDVGRPGDRHGRPAPLSPVVRDQFRRQRTRDTKPEVALRRELHARGLRYRIDRPVLAGHRFRADLVFGPARVAVFVDGCFWHACPEHGNRPKNNSSWWNDKLAANIRRDRRTDEALTAAGWISYRIWEHEDPSIAASQVAALIHARRA